MSFNRNGCSKNSMQEGGMGKHKGVPLKIQFLLCDVLNLFQEYNKI